MTTTSADSLVSLAEFQRLTGLSDSAVLWLLKHNKLPLAYTSELGLRVDSAHASTRTMVESMVREHDELLTADSSLLMARITALINTHLESILETAQARLATTPPKSS